MAKIIKITPECIEDIRRSFEETLRTAKFSDGKISFTKSFTNIERHATVYFTQIAWAKMQALIKGYDKEVAWHGLAYRGDDSGADEYFITDILVYPQEVTGATVTTDQEKYQTWLMSHEDDVFESIRMQGHSHVNMSTYPSAVDTTLYERILDQLEDDMFYIFMIYNKRGDKTVKIYDLGKNLLFETADVTVKILESEDEMPEIHGDGITDEEAQMLQECLSAIRIKRETDGFVKSAADMVKDKPTPAPSNSAYGGNYGGNYGGYYNGYRGYYNDYGYGYSSNAKESVSLPAKQDKNTNPAQVVPVKTSQPEVKKSAEQPTTSKFSKKGARKGKRVKMKNKKYGNVVKFESASDDDYDIPDDGYEELFCGMED